MKICSKCGKEKDEVLFFKHRHTRDRLYPHCKDCQRLAGKKWYHENLIKARASKATLHAKIRARKTAQGLCSICLKVFAQLGKTSCSVCQESRRRKAAERRQRQKKLCFDYYGRVCICCTQTFNHDAFLTLNHINNDGAEHRRSIGKSGASNFYAWVIKNKFPNFLETNCWNCNCARMVYGACPHQEKIDDNANPNPDASE